MTEEKLKKNKNKIFYLGLIIFAIGVIATRLGYSLGPSQPYTFDIYYLPFLNYISIVGIAIAVAGYFMGRKKHEQ